MENSESWDGDFLLFRVTTHDVCDVAGLVDFVFDVVCHNY